MRFASFLSRIFTALLLLLPFTAMHADDPPPATSMIGRLPAGKVLFLGNSITLHAPKPDIGWTGNWGMAASAEEKDYVHLLTADIARAAGATPRTVVRNLAGFEREYETFDLATELKAELEFRADIVVLAIGENVSETTTDEARAKFAAAYARLLAVLKEHGQPAIFVRGSFWPNAVKDGIMRKAGADAGAAFVDIAALGADASNAASSERKIGHPGVAGHPGDKGMRAIADAIFAALQERSAVGRDAMRVLLRGEAGSELAPHGSGNVYAPEVHRDGQRWLMWYGGQGRDGHDRIHLADSTDGERWTKRGVVLDCGTANHVNDPSVVRVGAVWWMFYTVAEKGELDEIAAATSTDGVKWEKRGIVLKRGEGSAWDSWKVGRPSVLHEGDVFRMWFDGQPTPEAAASNPSAAAVKRESRAVGYAESPDGSAWQRRPEPVFREGAGAVHISRVGGSLIMLIESHTGVRWADSHDGLTWNSRGLLLPLSGNEDDRFGHVTPFLHTQDGKATVFFGAAARKTWDGNAISAAPVRLPTQ